MRRLPHVVVIAAGLGTRLRPLTERFAKPVLPIGGRPVIALLLRELAASGFEEVTVVVGHLGEQVERLLGDGSGFGVNLRYARQQEPLGSAHAVTAARPEAPYLVIAADNVYSAGDIRRFADAWRSGGEAGAIAVRPAGRGRLVVRDGVVVRLLGPPGEGVSAAPLWAVGPELAARVAALPGRQPFELSTAFQEAIDAGERVAGIAIGPTRDLTAPVDLLVESFPYLADL